MKSLKQRQLSAIFTILSSLFATATSFGDPADGGPQQHPINTPTHNASPFNWQALKELDIVDFRYEFLPMNRNGRVNPENKFITARLNQWI